MKSICRAFALMLCFSISLPSLLAQRKGHFNQSANLRPDKSPVSLRKKPAQFAAGPKQVSVQAAANNGYVAGATHNVYFTFVINNTDFEYGDSLSLTFPAGVTINSVSNDEFFGPSFDAGGAPEAFNGIAGQTVSWGDNDNNYGGITSQGNVYNFSMNLSFGGAISGAIPVVVHLSGDEFGNTPGNADLTFNIAADLNPMAQVQVIHNVADLAAEQVDIRVNGLLPDVDLDDMAFRTASTFLNVSAGTPVELSINDPSSVDASMPIFAEIVTLDPGQSYVVIAQGIASGSGYSPAPPISFAIFAGAQQAAQEAEMVDVLLAHNATDAPTVNVNAPLLMTSLAQNLAYGSFNPYVSLEAADYTIEIATTQGANTVQYYSAPLQTLGLAGSALTVLASGFLNPAANSNGSEFGLWVATADGGSLIPLPELALAQIQVINNSADLASAAIDVRINGELPEDLDDLGFRQSSPFLLVDAGVAVTITTHAANSVDASTPISTSDFPGGFTANEKYVAIARGIQSEFSYEPDSDQVPFGLSFYTGARSAAANSGDTDVLIYHGSTDAPTVNINELALPAPGLVTGLAYDNFTNYFEIATTNLVLEVTQTDNDEVIATYSAPINTFGLTGSAVTVLASGFAEPGNNSFGASFGLWVSLPQGGNLIPLQLYNTNDIPCGATAIDAFNTPVSGNNLGADIDVNEVRPPNGDCSDFSSWCDGAPGQPLAAITNTVWFSFEAPASGGVEISTCGPMTDFDTQIALYAATNCADYSSFTLLAANDDFDAAFDCAAPSIFASRLNRCGLTPGATYYVQVDGYAGAQGNFDLIVSPLEFGSCAARVQFVHNSADLGATSVDVRINGELVATSLDDLTFRTATPTLDILGGQEINLSINPSNSVDDSNAFLNLDGLILSPGGSYQMIIQGIASDAGYAPDNGGAPLEVVIIDGFIETIPSQNNTFIAVIHGATDAAAIDVVEQFVIQNELFGNLAYGDFDGYSSVPVNNYTLGLTAAGQSDILQSYALPLTDLNLGGTAVSIFASGFFNPQSNSNGPEFGLWMSLPTGGDLIPLTNVTSTREREVLAAFRTYPNPADESVTLEFIAPDSERLQLTVFNVHGQQVHADLYATGAQAQKQVVSTEGWPAGIYTVVLSNSKGRNATKVVVMH